MLASSAVAFGPTLGALAPAAAGEPLGPEDPAYTARDTQNVADAYGRITGPGGQLRNPAYLAALATERRACPTLVEVRGAQATSLPDAG